VLPADEQLARWLRREVLGGSSGGSASSEPASGNPAGGGCALLLAANKCERRGGGEGAVAAALAESMRLGLGEPVALSAMTGEGMTELYAALQPLLDPLIETRQAAVQQLVAGRDGEAEERAGGVGGGQLQAGSGAPEGGSSSSGSGSSSGTSGGGGPLKIAIMGLPNVVRSLLPLAHTLLCSRPCPAPLTVSCFAAILVAHGPQVCSLPASPSIRAPSVPSLAPTTPFIFPCSSRRARSCANCPPTPTPPSLHPAGQVHADQLAAARGAVPDGAGAGADARRCARAAELAGAAGGAGGHRGVDPAHAAGAIRRERCAG
jgi:hypothetical protein